MSVEPLFRIYYKKTTRVICHYNRKETGSARKFGIQNGLCTGKVLTGLTIGHWFGHQIQDIRAVIKSLTKFDSSQYNETNLFDKIKDQGKIKNLFLIFSAFELGFGDAVADLDLAKIDQYYKDNVTSLGKKFSCSDSGRCFS